MITLSSLARRLKQLAAILVAALFAPAVVARLAPPAAGELDAVVVLAGLLIVSLASYGIRESHLQRRVRSRRRSRSEEHTPALPHHIEEDDE